MKKNLFATTLWLTLLAGALALNGCVFNVDRITKQKSVQVSSAGLRGAILDMTDYSCNLAISGTTDSVVKATLTVSDLATHGQASSPADELTVSVTAADSVGSVALSYAGTNDNWELLRVEDIALSCNRSLDVTAKAVSGNIAANGVEGFLTLRTTSGNVNAEVAGGCIITVESGNIDVSLKPGSGFSSAAMTTKSGNIKITVPSGFKANLDLASTSGNVKAPGNNKTQLNGGNPAVIIKCKTTSGNITVVEN
jgi:DUF4097 and DUF4098 domain-containing protein YvlB